jgi:hypothetical protein
MKIFRIVPLDRKGEIDGNTWYTDNPNQAMRAQLEGHSVMMCEVESWVTVTFKPVEEL